jgi:hypothetical protein
MVLLFNCFITNKSSTGGHWENMRAQGVIGVTQDRGNLRTDDKINIAKYTLSSLSKFYPWKRAIIKIQLDEEYFSEDNKKSLESYIREEFKGIDLIYSDKRNLIQQDWIDTYSLINDDLVHYCCNHDHVALNNSIEDVYNFIKNVKQNNQDENITIAYSNWSEFVRTAKEGYIDHHDYSPSKPNLDYKLDENYFSYKGHCYDSVHIISKKLYENWFLKHNWDDNLNRFPQGTFKSGHLELPRTDGVGIIDIGFIRNKMFNDPTPIQNIIIPYKELARHFDGHFYQGITNNQVPALDIPIGFFEKNIKIRYGYDDYKEGWTNINPKNNHYYAYDKSGTDYKFTLEELPLFWKDKISIIDSNPLIDEEEMIQYRLKSVLEMIYTDAHVYPAKYHSLIDKELETKILNEYLKHYPQYQII